MENNQIKMSHFALFDKMQDGSIEGISIATEDDLEKLEHAKKNREAHYAIFDNKGVLSVEIKPCMIIIED